VINVQSKGAVGDGVADDWSAIQHAIRCAQPNGEILLPPGIYKVSKPIRLAGSGLSLAGCGIGVTTIMAASASGDAIEIADGSNRITVMDLTVNSTVPRTGGGIASRGIASNIRILNTQVMNQWVGYVLCGTDSSTVQNALAQRNYSSGIVIANAPGPYGGGCQWSLHHVVSELNDGDGITVQALPTGTPQITLGGMFDVNMFANSGYGLLVSGLAGTPIYGVRVNGMFSGQNGRDSIYLHSFGNQHNISNFFIELDGTSTTGRAYATAATQCANGITLTDKNQTMRLSAGLVKAPSRAGIVNMCRERLLVSDVCIEDCGQSSPSAGFYHQTATGRVVLNGITSGNTGLGASQNYGLYADDLGLLAVSGYDLTNNSIAAYGGGNPAAIRLSCGFQ